MGFKNQFNTNRLVWSLLFLATSCLCSANGNAPDELAVALIGDKNRYEIGLFTQYLADSDNALDISSVRSLPRSEWTSLDSDTVSLGFYQSPHWFRASFININSTSNQWILELGYPLLDFIDFFIVRDGKVIGHEVGGDHVPLNLRQIQFRENLFKIEIPQGQLIEVYFKISTTSSLQFSATLLSLDEFIQMDHNEQLVYGLYFGMLIILFIYNALIYSVVRDTRYLYYLLYISGFILFQFTLTGFALEYLWREGPMWEDEIVIAAICITTIGMLLFSKNFLELRYTMPKSYKIYNVGIAYYLLILAYVFVGDYPIAVISATIGAMLRAVVILVTGALRLLNHFKPARYFMLGWSFFLVGVVIYGCKTLGILQPSPLTEYAIQIGSTMEALLLSLALADRINVLSNESRRIQKEVTQKLQTEVTVRTRQLEKRTEEAEAAKRRAESLRIEAENVTKLKSQFLANMSHEIRTPMNGILGLADMLVETELSELQRKYLDTINSSGRSLLRVINDILDYSKIESGKMDIESIELDLDRLVDDCISIFAAKVEEKQIPLVSYIAEEVPRWILGDPTRIQQIMLNLIGNAFKFTDHGQIIIRISRESGEFNSASGDEQSACDNKVNLKFSVIDSGLGITEEQQKKLFRSFAQADSSTTRRYGGTGLGLTISKTLAELMGGKIGVSSEYHKGSEFWFTITTQSAPNRSKARNKFPTNINSVFLILTENASVNSIYCEQIQAWGGRAHGVEQVETLQTLLTEQKTVNNCRVIVLIDYNFRNDGLHVGEEIIKLNPQVNHWVYMYPQHNSKIANDALEIGFNSAMELPVGPSDFYASVSSYLGIKSKPKNNQKGIYETSHSFSHINVLVAEDNAVNQMVIKGALRKLGITPLIANNGKEAVELVGLGDHKIHIIFMDCEMPKMDGYTATRIIKDMTIVDVPYIVGLSAHALEESKEKGLNSGMDAYITKPIDRQELTTIIMRMDAIVRTDTDNDASNG